MIPPMDYANSRIQSSLEMSEGEEEGGGGEVRWEGRCGRFTPG